MKASWIAIDWGTTNFRAYLMSEQGVCIDKIYHPKGLLSVEKEQFPAVFDALIKRWTEELGSLPVVMAGMVGSQQGWCNVPYKNTPICVDTLVGSTYKVELLSGSKAHIVPGVTCLNQFGIPEVMRGEEVQLVGLSNIVDGDFNAVLFGTHSKHVSWRDGQLKDFSTVMTGELYSILTNHSILAKGLPSQEFNKPAFIKGVDMSQICPLNHILFSARTLKLFEAVEEKSVFSYISGLLVGHEFTLSDKSKKIYLVGSESLSKNYEVALSHLNIESEFINGDSCFLNGMNEIYNSGLNNE